MIRYSEADKSTVDVMKEVCRLHHPKLQEYASIKVMFAEDDESGGLVHCLKQGGYTTFGIIERTNVKRRSEGGPDAVIYLDKADWEAASQEDRQGMMDHLLTRITVRENEKGEVLSDSAKRPKLDLVKYDLRLNGFKAVAERNQGASPEARMFTVCKGPFAQMTLPFFEFKPEPPPKKKSKGNSSENPTADMTEAEKDAYVKQNLDAQAAKGRPKSWATEREELIQAIDKKLKSGKLEASTKNRAIIELNIIKDGEKSIDEADGDGLIKYRTRLDNISLKDLKQMFKAAK